MLFTRWARVEIPQLRLWEDANHITVLTPFPNTPGFTVVILGKHLSSDILALDDDDFILLVKRASPGSPICTKALNVDYVGVFFEGLEIDYAHVTLVRVPIATSIQDTVGPFYHIYPGCLSTQPGPVRDVEDVQAGLNLEGWERG